MRKCFIVLLALAFIMSTGIFAFADAGKCTKGNCKNGKGTVEFKDGKKYSGEFKDGKAHGKGSAFYKDGRKYKGEWRNGKPNGQGKMRYKDGSKFVGSYKNGKRHGKGKVIGPTGKVVKAGTWNNGKYTGK